ncbi:TetR/AcrR family transcriptional regulator [Nocardioides zeae]|uniref:TetR/AcrR family transcriptional regulator n=1 Tax=Nocardioides imazamoxiresistens TaxID=3231893 RepID=A0ABU3PVQ1_9ACTN|nr:TetR/AcrR family transcriptional regulator [Nocardioides zeae]MDT9593321.1 TetR/AcrR family transcriptional regulator [Nocardioides zeae]
MSRSTSTYHHGNLRPVLLAAALDLLETQSAAALSLREVARRAGVSHNAPYHHFGDRSGLLAAAGAEAMRQLVAAQRAAYEAEADPRDALVALGVAYVEWAVAHPGAFGVIYDPEICAPGAPSETMAPLIAANEELLSAAIAATDPRPDGTTGRAAELAAREAGAWGSVHGLAALVTAGHLPRAAVRPALESLFPRS